MLPCSPEKAADWHAYLSECIMHSARLLESLGSNTDFSTKFVEQGGLKLLLRLYTLKHLPPTFGSSSAAHALVAAVRVLNQAAVASVTTKVVEELTGQLRTTLLLGMVRAQLTSMLMGGLVHNGSCCEGAPHRTSVLFNVNPDSRTEGASCLNACSPLSDRCTPTSLSGNAFAQISKDGEEGCRHAFPHWYCAGAGDRFPEPAGPAACQA